jgi:DNA-binding CsgD family transcriptional regulator
MGDRSIKFTEDQIIEIKNLYKSGKSIKLIAEQMGYSYTSIRNRLKKEGAELNKRGFQNGATDEDKERIIKYYEEGMTAAAIARKVGISRSGVAVIVKASGMSTDSDRQHKQIKFIGPIPLIYGPFLSIEQAKEKGLTQYFTGKPCSKGHISRRSVHGGCMHCARESAMNKYAEENKAIEKICPQCGTRFTCGFGTEKTAKTIYCRPICSLRNYRNKPEVKARLEANVKEWRKENAEHMRIQARQKYRNDPARRVSISLRSRVLELVKNAKTTKTDRTSKLVGTSGKKVMAHLESQFENGMSWENFGQWHIDHIRPCASFDLTEKAQQYTCFNWRNLQPLWGADNIAKHDDYEPQDEAAWAYLMRELGYEGELFLLFEEGPGGF